MKIRNTILAGLCFAVVTVCSAQVSFTYQLNVATCSSNGSIEINATGGTGTLNYQLASACLALPLTQQTPTFNNLAPCEYTITVTDGGSGASATETVSVGGSYQSPNISLFCSSCSIEASLTGGLAPLSFSYSTSGLGGPFTDNTPSSNPIFDNIQGSANYWIKVTDACGNVSVETCQTGEGSLADFTYEIGLDGQIRVLSVTGGISAVEYILSSDAGTFTNATGVFPQNQWGCNMTLTISDECTNLTKVVMVHPKILSVCSNFAAGSATLGNVINGIPPFTFLYISPTNTIISTNTNELTGLPINDAHYTFQVVDACGNESEGIYKQKKYPIFEQAPLAACNANSITLYTPDDGCAGGFDADSWPFDVTCLSCTPVVSDQVDSSGVPITFTGNAPGDWEFAIEDGCEDQMVCSDSVILLIEPFCDSLQANLIDRFTCDNGTISDRPLSSENGIFVLFDENDNVLGTNDSGLFFLPDSGTYKVTLAIPGCGTHSATMNIGYWQPVEPLIFTYIYNALSGDKCLTFYQLVISPEDGPFTLTGGPNDISLLLDENYLTNTCQYYSVEGLLPGEYLLAEVDHCGTKPILLPAPNYNLKAVPFGNCPGSGTITVSGAQNLEQWVAWGQANNATINWPSSITDNYSLDVTSSGALTAQSGSPFTFVNVEAGEHTIYLYTLNSTCPVDTALVFVPEADTLSFEVSTGVICDGESATTLHFEVLSGKPPYFIEQVDCANPALVLATHILPGNSLSLPGIIIGDYCYRLVDSCITSLDHQFSVQYFQDDIELDFNCDNTITLSVDSLNATYLWLAENGTTIGNTQKITLQNTGADANYTVQVDIGECIVERSILVPATEIVPNLAIVGEPFFCIGETVVLNAISLGTQFNWNNGASTASIIASQQGEYSATVTNIHGCTATTKFILTLDVPNTEIQVLSGGSGFGLNCFQDSNGVLNANPLAGIAPFSFEWSNLEATQTITNLKTGDFAVILTDGIGCKDTTSITLTEPGLFVPELYFLAPRCFGIEDGYVEVPNWSGGAGGVSVQLSNSSPKFAPVTFDNLPPGEYLVEISDANGCKMDSSIFFDAPQQLFVDLGGDLTIDLGDSIFLDPQVSFLPVDSFLWRSNSPEPMLDLTIWSTPLETSYYSIIVWDTSGCAIEDKLNVRVIKEIDVYAPTAFSPNGDGTNDLFTLFARTSAVTIIRSFQVYDRYGEQVFDRKDFQPNIEQLGWDGKFDGETMNPAVFAWKAEIEFIDGRVEVLYGDVTLMR